MASYNLKPEIQKASKHSLVEKVRNGNRSAFEELFGLYYEELVLYAKSRIPSHDVAEGVVQEVFVRIWQRRTLWNPGGALRAYLYATVRNESRSYLRRLRRRRGLFETWWGSSESTAEDENRYELEELHHAAQNAVEALPKRRREIYCLSRHYGLTYKEIAALLDISIKTVEGQMGRALKTLRDSLNDFYPDKTRL